MKLKIKAKKKFKSKNDKNSKKTKIPQKEQSDRVLKTVKP